MKLKALNTYLIMKIDLTVNCTVWIVSVKYSEMFWLKLLNLCLAASHTRMCTAEISSFPSDSSPLCGLKVNYLTVAIINDVLKWWWKFGKKSFKSKLTLNTTLSKVEQPWKLINLTKSNTSCNDSGSSIFALRCLSLSTFKTGHLFQIHSDSSILYCSSFRPSLFKKIWFDKC